MRCQERIVKRVSRSLALTLWVFLHVFLCQPKILTFLDVKIDLLPDVGDDCGGLVRESIQLATSSYPTEVWTSYTPAISSSDFVL